MEGRQYFYSLNMMEHPLTHAIMVMVVLDFDVLPITFLDPLSVINMSSKLRPVSSHFKFDLGVVFKSSFTYRFFSSLRELLMTAGLVICILALLESSFSPLLMLADLFKTVEGFIFLKRLT